MKMPHFRYSLIAWYIIALCVTTIGLLAYSNYVNAATVWTPTEGAYQQQKSNAKTPKTRYVQMTNEQIKALYQKLYPLVLPPIVLVQPVIIPSSNMPYVDKTLIPIGAMSKNYLDLIPAQYPPSQHTNPDEFNNGEFRVACNFSHMLFDDPIVKPGQSGASHLHTFFGNSQTDANSTNASLVASGSSSCDGGIMNRSGYWVPTVIDTRTGRPIAPSGGNFYYKTEHRDVVVAPPKGLRMIAGSMMASSTQEHLHYWCADKSDNNVSGDQGYIPSCAVGNHLMAVINFPAYWDGVNLDSADHKSHMSYAPDATHTVQIPDITFNVRYDIMSGDDTSKWRMSSDMYDTSKPGGYSLHGDWMNGWSNDPVSGKSFSDIFTQYCLKAGVDCGNSLLGDGRQFQY